MSEFIERGIFTPDDPFWGENVDNKNSIQMQGVQSELRAYTSNEDGTSEYVSTGTKIPEMGETRGSGGKIRTSKNGCTNGFREILNG